MFPLYLYIVVGLILSMWVSRLMLPRIVLISKRKRLLDVPNLRKVHSSQVPRLGGVAFLPAIMFSYCIVRGLFWHYNAVEIYDEALPLGNFLFFCAGLLLIAFIGMADDIVGVSYKRKFCYQVLCAVLLVFPSNYITDLQGLFGVYAISAWVGIPLTLLLIVAVVNAANLIDGVDGLCAGLGIVIFSVLGYLLFAAHNIHLGQLAVCTVGTAIVFFGYNVFGRKLKIFMGDSGSLLFGYIASFLALQLIEEMQAGMEVPRLTLVSLMGILFVPLADMTRVFAQRILKGKSPFFPDKRHIHHKLLQLGASHMGCSGCILIIEVGYILGNFWMADRMSLTWAFVVNVGVMMLLIQFLNWHIRRRERRWL